MKIGTYTYFCAFYSFLVSKLSKKISKGVLREGGYISMCQNLGVDAINLKYVNIL